MKALVSDNSLDRGAMRVAMMLLDYYNPKTDTAFPSYGRLAIDLGVDRRNVIRAIQSLVSSGWFEITVKGGRAHPNRSNRYRPCWDKALETVSPASPFNEGETVTQTVIKGDANGHKGCHTRHPNLLKNLVNNQVKRRKGDQQGCEPCGSPLSEEEVKDEFARFFKQYPKQEGNLEAFEEYTRVLNEEDVTPDELLHAVMQYGVSVMDKDPQYIKFPSNWLKGKGWLDNPKPPNTKKPGSRKSTITAMAEIVSDDPAVALRKKMAGLK